MKNDYHLRVSFDKSQFLPWFVSVGSKHYREIFINVFCLEFNLHISAKDWLVKEDKLLYNKYEIWSRNQKYKHEELESYIFPREKMKAGKNFLYNLWVRKETK